LAARKQTRFKGFPLEPEKQGTVLRMQMEQEKATKIQRRDLLPAPALSQ
jgi:hypothetical protein